MSLWGEDSKEAKVLKALCQYENINLSRHLNPYFSKKLPAKKLIGILDDFKKEEGACVTIEKIDQHNYLYTTDRSQRAMQLYLDKNQKVRGLWFGNATAFSDKLLVVAEEFKKLSGQSSVLLLKNNKAEILAYNQNKPMAVDSSANLLLLKLLKDRVKKTKLNWSSPIKLNKSLAVPTAWNGGRLNQWPDKSPVTVQTLATFTQAYSDDTAAAHIFSILGRKRLEKESPRNKPYLSPVEFYKVQGSLADDYGAKKIGEKRKYVKSMAKKSWNDLAVIEKPFHMNSIGWQFTTKELCNLIYSLRKEAFSSVNSGLAQTGGWRYASFIMGRAPGVLQYTQLLRPQKSKDHYCVSVTWNDPDGGIEPTKVDALIGRILSKIQ